MFRFKTMPCLANSLKSLVQEALLSFNAITLIFLSSLGVVILLRPQLPILEVSIVLANLSFCLVALTTWGETFNFLAISFCLGHCARVKRISDLFFWGSNLFFFPFFLIWLKNKSFLFLLSCFSFENYCKIIKYKKLNKKRSYANLFWVKTVPTTRLSYMWVNGMFQT